VKNADEDELEPLEDDDEELGDLEDLDEEDGAAAAAAVPDDDDDDDSDEASLDELLAQRAASRRGGEESDEDDDILSFVPEPEVGGSPDPLPSKIIPVKDRQEFVCNNCHLVKKKSQLADPKRMYCRDCV